jgi:hypothetical protein
MSAPFSRASSAAALAAAAAAHAQPDTPATKDALDFVQVARTLLAREALRGALRATQGAPLEGAHLWRAALADPALRRLLEDAAPRRVRVHRALLVEEEEGEGEAASRRMTSAEEDAGSRRRRARVHRALLL